MIPCSTWPHPPAQQRDVGSLAVALYYAPQLVPLKALARVRLPDLHHAQGCRSAASGEHPATIYQE